MPSKEEIKQVKVRGERIRRAIEEVLVKAKGTPTTSDQLREWLPMIDGQMMGFQLGRMVDEKRIVRNEDAYSLKDC